MARFMSNKSNNVNSSSNNNNEALSNFFRNFMDKMCACGSADTVDDSMGDYFDDVSSIYDENKQRLGRYPQEEQMSSSSHFNDDSIDSLHRKETFPMGNRTIRYSFGGVAGDDIDNDALREDDNAIREAPATAAAVTTTTSIAVTPDSSGKRLKTSTPWVKNTNADKLQVLSLSPTNTYTTVSLSYDDGDNSLYHHDDDDDADELSSTVSTAIVSHVLPFRKRKQREGSSSEEDAPYRHLLRMKPQNYIHCTDDDDEEEEATNGYGGCYRGELTYSIPVLSNDEFCIFEPPAMPELK